MKKFVFSVMGLALMATMFLTSCKEDEGGTSEVTDKVEEGILEGTMTESLTLDASVSYSLTGSFIVPAGVTLTIPAGTEIIAEANGTDVYIAVLMGGTININGSATNPVLMTSENANPGDWGGLTLCGKGITTSGAESTAEVGGFIYGGDDNTDSSGSIEYLVIKGTGAQIDSESQYNGVSFYAVGSGTTVNNVAVINGSDDGVEFFGGDVDVTNLFLENNEDDAVDWTEGWSGSVTNVYISHTIEDFSTAFEGDKENASPVFTNVTCISTTGGTGLQFKKTSGGVITGLFMSGYDIDLDMKDETAVNQYTDNVTIEGSAATSIATVITDTAITETEYGQYTLDLTATAPTVDVSGWTWVSATTSALSELNGTVIGDVTLDASVAYDLTGAYIVPDGASLTIPAGTKITAEAGGTGVYIAVLMGGEIFIEGTAAAPVVISSADANPGDWGGLTICGKAETTAGTDVEAEVGGFIYGGTDTTDSSGSIEYLVIKGTGAQINSESQYNGVSCYALGSGTTLSNIAVINGSDDGIEFFGGSVSVTNIYLQDNEDDAVDWTEGWNGGITNTYIKHDIADFSTAFEGDKENKWPVFTNVTAVSTTGGIGLQFKKTSGAKITNLYLSGYDIDLDMKDETTAFAYTGNVTVDGTAATDIATLVTDATASDYSLTLTATAETVDVSGWSWVEADL